MSNSLKGHPNILSRVETTLPATETIEQTTETMTEDLITREELTKILKGPDITKITETTEHPMRGETTEDHTKTGTLLLATTRETTRAEAETETTTTGEMTTGPTAMLTEGKVRTTTEVKTLRDPTMIEKTQDPLRDHSTTTATIEPITTTEETTTDPTTEVMTSREEITSEEATEAASEVEIEVDTEEETAVGSEEAIEEASEAEEEALEEEEAEETSTTKCPRRAPTIRARSWREPE